MTIAELSTMTGGWFVGAFAPVVLHTDACEVACKRYQAGAVEPRHVHRIATEVTLIVSGRVVMNGTELTAGQIIRLEPGEPADFAALDDTVTVVVKTPSVAGDKYVIAPVSPEQ
jgi:quercetin dioxygenase-like cupin family protein